MKPLFVGSIAILCLGLGACAGGGDPNCTTEPRSAWMPEAEMQNRIRSQGYKINEFKVAGNCYEIYGWDRQGRKVEIYFNPVTGDIVKSEIE